MARFKEMSGGLIMCVCEIIIGILLLINPLSFTSGIIMGGGILLLLSGITSLIAYFRTSPVEAAKQQMLSKGLGLMLLGGFLVLKSDWLIAVFPILTLLYAVGILMTGLMRIQWAVDSLRLKRKQWYWHAIGALLAIVFAVIIILNPFSATNFIWTFVALSLIAEAVIDILTLVFTGRKTA